jgi:hypothetical protein
MKRIFLLILLFLIISCKPHQNSLYQFDPRTLKENKITLSEIADDINYIPLDNKYPLRLIYDKIMFINNSIYLSAMNVGVLVFNEEGKLLRKIGTIGRGPGEYIHNFNFSIDEKTETVYVCDEGNIIKVYSKTGDFLRSFSLQKYGSSVDVIDIFNSKLFAAYAPQYDDSKHDWIVLDTLGNLIKKQERTTPKFLCNAFSPGGAYKYGNILSVWNVFTDTVFSILPDLTKKPSFIISKGEHRLPKARISSIEEMSKYMQLKQIFETSRFIDIKYYYCFPVNKYALVLIDKKNNKSFLTFFKSDGGFIPEFTGGIINDLDGGTGFLPRSNYVDNDREFMVGLLDPYQIKARIKNDEFRNSIPKNPEKKKEFEKLANSLKETDNPVLVLVRLKK